MGALGYPIIDMDHHYYEPDDCCTRHIESRFADRAVHIEVAPDGRRHWYVGARPMHYDRLPNDMVLEPGELRRLLKMKRTDPHLMPRMMRSTDDPAFRDRDERVKRLDAFGVEACVMFSSFFFETEFEDDPEAGFANIRAYNRWAEEEWGWAYKNRLFTPAMVSLMDREFAITELERVLAAGTRLLLLRTGPQRGRSPASPYFDPFWARVQESGLPVVLHVSLSTYESEFSRLWGEKTNATIMDFSAFQWFTCFMQRPIMDTLASMIFTNLFGRFPKLKILSIEHGSRWVKPLIDDLDHIMLTTNPGTIWPGGKLNAKPSEIFREHIYVAPFYEEYHEAPIAELAETIGIDRLIFGSDWPHGEGKATPMDYLDDVKDLSAPDLRAFMRGNGQKLLGLAG